MVDWLEAEGAVGGGLLSALFFEAAVTDCLSTCWLTSDCVDESCFLALLYRCN